MQQLLKEVTEVVAELQKSDETQSEVPHHSHIEESAYETGQHLARMIPESRVREVSRINGRVRRDRQTSA